MVRGRAFFWDEKGHTNGQISPCCPNDSADRTNEAFPPRFTDRARPRSEATRKGNKILLCVKFVKWLVARWPVLVVGCDVLACFVLHYVDTLYCVCKWLLGWETGAMGGGGRNSSFVNRSVVNLSSAKRLTQKRLPVSYLLSRFALVGFLHLVCQICSVPAELVGWDAAKGVSHNYRKYYYVKSFPVSWLGLLHTVTVRAFRCGGCHSSWVTIREASSPFGCGLVLVLKKNETKMLQGMVTPSPTMGGYFEPLGTKLTRR